jgi:hypothetical protein
MPDRQEERPLCIGSAVRFTHGGTTIHGHLLQRQGRRRFAKVIDPEGGIWRIAESALKDTGRARRATMVTPQDEARADRRVGGEVTFSGPGVLRSPPSRQSGPMPCGIPWDSVDLPAAGHQDS